MKRTTFLSKLVAGYGALILVTVLVVAMLGGSALESGAYEQIEAGLRSQVELFESLAHRDADRIGKPGYELELARLGQRSGVRFTVIALDGKVLADSSLPSANLDNHGSRPEVSEAMATGRSASSLRRSKSVGTELLYLAKVVELPGRKLVLRVSQPLDLVRSGYRRFLQAMSVGVGLTVVLAIVGGFWFLRRVTEPLRNMTSVALDRGGRLRGR
ncbi:MAG: hypothetical protein R3F30_01170 [Planctomycetota bacterium]